MLNACQEGMEIVLFMTIDLGLNDTLC